MRNQRLFYFLLLSKSEQVTHFLIAFTEFDNYSEAKR